MVTEGMEPKKENIPAMVDAILDCLAESHNIVSRMKPAPIEAEEDKSPPEPIGLERQVIRARDSAARLNRRLIEIADSVGRL